MALFNIFDISGTGLSAQTVRLNATASNIANAETASSSIEQTYRGRHPVFSVIQAEQMRTYQNNGHFNLHDEENDPGHGVQILGVMESEAPLQPRYEPEHPLANEEGYVYYPNINVVEEMANMISASRSYQVNVEVMNNAKSMMQRVLQLGQ